MKTKYTLLIVLFTSTFAFSQNSNLAKSYFFKAKEELEEKRYKKALEYIQKSKEYAGNTNPDIMYVELKSRYAFDKNINKTKELCNQFIKEAFEDDERTEEVSNLLIDILESDNYYKSGFKKSFEYPPNNGVRIIIYYNEKGVKTKMLNWYKNEYIYIYTYFNKTGKDRVAMHLKKEGFSVFIQDTITKYKSNQHYLIRKENFSTISNISSFVNRTYPDMNDEVYFKRNDIGKIKSFHPFNEQTVRNIEIDLPKIRFGIIKELEYENYNGSKDYYTFNEEGIPLSWKVYRNDKIQKTYSYDIKSKDWNEN